MGYVAGQRSGNKMYCPCHLCLGLSGMAASIIHHTPLVCIDLNSITELTYPVCLKFFENIQNNKCWATFPLYPLELSFILSIVLEGRGKAQRDVGRLFSITDHS